VTVGCLVIRAKDQAAALTPPPAQQEGSDRSSGSTLLAGIGLCGCMCVVVARERLL